MQACFSCVRRNKRLCAHFDCRRAGCVALPFSRSCHHLKSKVYRLRYRLSQVKALRDSARAVLRNLWPAQALESSLQLLPTTRSVGRSVASSLYACRVQAISEDPVQPPKVNHVSPAQSIARPKRLACVTSMSSLPPHLHTQRVDGADEAGDCNVTGPRLYSTTTRTVRPSPSQRPRSRPRPQPHSASPSGPTARRASQPPLLLPAAPTRLQIIRTT